MHELANGRSVRKWPLSIPAGMETSPDVYPGASSFSWPQAVMPRRATTPAREVVSGALLWMTFKCGTS